MIAIDTNILVRYAIKDDRRHAIKATEFLKNNPCHILKTVLLELVWVLSSSAGYNLPKAAVGERVRHICGLPTVEIEDAGSVVQALAWYESGMDFADALHLASSSKFAGFATFDRQLANRAVKLSTKQKTILLN